MPDLSTTYLGLKLPGPLVVAASPLTRTIDAIGRIRHDIGRSFIGGVFTTREIRGGGYNRVAGPDFQWRPNESDAISGELLVSSNDNPNRPDLSPAMLRELLSRATDVVQKRPLAGAKPGEVFLATDTAEGALSHQIFRSTDGGRTWADRNAGLAETSVLSLAVSAEPAPSVPMSRSAVNPAIKSSRAAAVARIVRSGTDS